MSLLLTSSCVLIIGIDGGTWTVLRPAIERGYMPFLKSLVDTGVSGVMTSTIPALTPPAWAAFQTGMNPGKTGVFCFTNLDRANHRLSFVSAEGLPETLWDAAGSGGKRVLVMNVPMTYPPRPVNGAMVTGLMTPSMKSAFTYPPDLKAELLRAVPDYHIFHLDNVRDAPPPQNIPAFIAKMVSILDNRTQAARYLIDSQKPDLCMVHFQTSDLVQHALWCHLDAQNPLYEADKNKYILEHYYRRLDASIEQVHQACSATDRSLNTFVVSDHGFESNKYRFNLGTWLNQQGLLLPDRKEQTPPWPKRITRALRVGRFLRFFVSGKSMARLEEKLAITPEAVDWKRSPVFVTSFSSEAGIYIMQGDASQRAATAQRIIDGLRDFRDPRTDKPIIEAIYHREEIYHGPRLELMPDIVVVPADGYMCNSHCEVGKPMIEEVDQRLEYIIGKHHSEGILIAQGPAIAGGKQVDVAIIDAAPTVLYCLGLEIPAECDGKVLMGLFTDDFRSARGKPRTSRSATAAPQDAASPVYSADDEEEIKKKLRDLGYM